MAAAAGVSFEVLGDVRVCVDGVEVAELGGPQPRALLAALVAAGGRVVQAESLVDAVWGDEPPASAAGTLHSYVSRLRKALGAAGEVLERRGPGYRLAVLPEALDWRRFEDLAERGRVALQAGDAAGAQALLVQAEALWRGPALDGLADRPFAAGLVARLDERRESAHGDRLEADLQLGRHAALLGELDQAVRARPLDEARWGRLALARYRSGQQAGALEALAEARRTLVDELGVEPGQALRDLELKVLRQDPSLDLSPTDRRRPVVTPPPRAARGDDVLVGRASELAVLVSALDDSATAARFGVVEGEPGIGKTRLLEEVGAIASARGALVLWGRSHESGAAPAFWPWLPVLRSLRAVDPDQAEEGLSALLDARGGDVTVTGLFEAMDAVTAALRRTAADRQVVVLLDDLQWADAASLSLIAFLAAHLTDERVLLLGTVRELDVGRRDELVTVLATIARRRGSRRLRLAGLDAAGTAALVRQTSDQEVDEQVVRVIHERAEGNPFFATELTRLLDGDPAADGELARSVPAGVSDVVRQRLAGLPGPTLALLQLCAVMGRGVDLGLLPLATGRDVAVCLGELEPAVVQRLLIELPDGTGALHFAHALVREVVVDDLPSVRRLQLHLQVADALAARGDGDDDAELLAEHLWAAAPLGVGERAAASLEAAAEVAVRRFALASASSLLVRAAGLRRAAGSTREHALAELHAVVRLTSVRRAMQGFGGVSDLLERGEVLARKAGRHDVERELLWATWAMADTACDFPRAEPIAERFRAWADQTDDPALRQFGRHVWGIQCWHRGRLRESRDALDDAHAARALISQSLPPERDSTLFSFEQERLLLATSFRLAVHELLEDLPEAASELDRLGDGLDPFAVAMVATFACHAPAMRGDHVRVAASAEQVVLSDRDGSMSFWGGQARMHLGWAVMRRGQVDEGLALWEDGRKVFTGAGIHTGMGLFLANASTALVDAGRLELGADLAGQAREELEVFREMWPEPIVLLAEAEVARARGEDAGGLYDAAARSADALGAVGARRRIEVARTRP